MSVDKGDTPLEDISFLARSESRVRIMEHLAETGRATQPELREQLDASRTTISRSLKSLTEKGWVERADGAYGLTRVGDLIAKEFSRMRRTVEVTEELREFLRWFPSDVAVPDLLGVSEFEVTTSTDADPYAPARKQSEILFTADSLRILLPATDLESTEAITEQVTERGLEVETIVSPGVEAVIEQDEFASLIREKVRTGRSTMLVAETDLPFYLGLADDGLVQIGLADDEGLPRVLLESTDERIRAWADDVYRTYRERARQKPVEEFA